MTFAKTVSMELQKNSWYRDGVIVVLSSLLIGLCSWIAIPLPITPVPIAFQNIVILFLALQLGSQRSAAAVFLFLVQGAMGLPVFALGKTGIIHILGPAGGYLIGYLVAAYVTGLMIEKIQRKTLTSAFLAMSVGYAIIYLFGSAYLSVLIGAKQALSVGVVPFLIGDLFKMVLALKVLQWIGWNRNSWR